MKTKKVIHIPERGCHNCRLHCVNHKECDSEYPCKQGMEWRPITESEQPRKDEAEKKTAKEFLNLKALKENYNDEDRGNHFAYWLDCSTVETQADKLISWLIEYAEFYHQEQKEQPAKDKTSMEMVREVFEPIQLGENSVVNEALELASKKAGKEQPKEVSDTIEDGFGSAWSKRCPECGKNSMQVVRPGKAQCKYCG